MKNSTSRHYAVISAYNGGAGNVFKTFNTDRAQAINAINQKNSQQVYTILTTKHAAKESRDYRYKVNKYQQPFTNEQK